MCVLTGCTATGDIDNEHECFYRQEQIAVVTCNLNGDDIPCAGAQKNGPKNKVHITYLMRTTDSQSRACHRSTCTRPVATHNACHYPSTSLIQHEP
jgi:hypothetical protein